MSDNKRANGEGTIKRRSDGRFEGQVRLELPSGESHRQSVYGKTKQEVSRKISKLKQQQRDNTLSLAKAPSLKQYLESWWYDERLKPSTLKNRELNVRVRIVPVIGGIKLDKVAPNQVKQVDNALKERGLSGAGRMQAFAVLRTALRQAFVEGLIPASPFDKVTWKPPVVQRAERVLSMQEKAQLLRIKDEWTPLWKLFIATGLRSGEALGLMWKDVDLQGHRLHIKQTISRDSGSKLGYRIGSPKTKKAMRTLEIQPAVAEIFREIRERQQAEATRIGEAWIDTGFVFTWKLGQPMVGDNAHYYLQRALQQVGVAPSRVHDLRHTFATDQLLAGTPMSEVSRMLGHASVSITLDIYAHILPEVQSQASETASRILEEAMRLAELQEVSHAS